MLFNNRNLIKFFFLFLLSNFLLSSSYASQSKIEQFDVMRNELYYSDKNSIQYQNLKQKLNKFVSSNKIDYSFSKRLEEVKELIKSCKYEIAIYELKDLIENNYEISKCNEYLGDISLKLNKASSKIASYYKKAIEVDESNINAKYKLAKLYLKENKNILGIQNLKEIVTATDDQILLEEIKIIVLNNIKPLDRYEANNLYEILGYIYEKQLDMPSSYKSFEKAIVLNKDDIFLKYYLADLYNINNKKAEALKLYNSILNDDYNDSQIRIMKANILSQEGEYNDAIQEYINILKKFPNSSYAKYSIYNIYKGKANPKLILEVINKNNVGYKINKLDVDEFANFLKNIGDTEGCMMFKEYSKTFDKPVVKSEAEIKKQNINNNENHPAKQIEKPVQKKIEKPVQKKIEKVYPKKAIKKVEVSKTKETKQAKLVKDTPENSKYKYALNKYLKIEPKDKLTYIAIANTYKLLKDSNSAIDNYKNALKLDPLDSDIYFNIGLTYVENNDLENAKKYLTKAINLDSSNHKAINMLAFVEQKAITKILNESYDKYDKKQYVQAFEILDEGIKVYKDNAQMYYYRALVYDAMNRNAAQIIDLQKAVEIDSGFYMAYYQLGHAYEKIRNERSALVAYEKFLSMEPKEKDLVDEVQKKVLYLENKYY